MYNIRKSIPKTGINCSTPQKLHNKSDAPVFPVNLTYTNIDSDVRIHSSC